MRVLILLGAGEEVDANHEVPKGIRIESQSEACKLGDHEGAAIAVNLSCSEFTMSRFLSFSLSSDPVLNHTKSLQVIVTCFMLPQFHGRYENDDALCFFEAMDNIS